MILGAHMSAGNGGVNCCFHRSPSWAGITGRLPYPHSLYPGSARSDHLTLTLGFHIHVHIYMCSHMPKTYLCTHMHIQPHARKWDMRRWSSSVAFYQLQWGPSYPFRMEPLPTPPAPLITSGSWLPWVAPRVTVPGFSQTSAGTCCSFCLAYWLP